MQHLNKLAPLIRNSEILHTDLYAAEDTSIYGPARYVFTINAVFPGLCYLRLYFKSTFWNCDSSFN